MKYQTLIFGLGNPEAQYGETRHNAGATVLNALAAAWDCPPWKPNGKFNAMLTEYNLPTSTSQNSILLAKSTTYMNESGWVASAISRFYQLQPENNYIIHDDLDLPLGKWKIQLGKGPKEHNGLLSLYQELGSKHFHHVRVGVDSRAGERHIDPKDYVLQRFSPLEREQLEQVIQEVVERLTSLCTA